MDRCGQELYSYSAWMDNSQSTICKPVKNNFKTGERISTYTTLIPCREIWIGSSPARCYYVRDFPFSMTLKPETLE